MRSPEKHTFARFALISVVAFAVTLLIAVPLSEAKRSDEADDPSRAMGGVEDVNSENYYDIVGHDQFVLLEFYAVWCGHCRKFSPIYEEFGKYIRIRPELQGRVVVGKVNAPTEPRIRRRYRISGYPTVILVPPNKHVGVEFTDNRNFNGLLDFVEREMAKKEYAIIE
ncbi:putative Thioredoxin [Leishmania utingensis]|uniref:Thioredoxin n=1 Tax=Leishmania utingensis TaxID=653362 RepID=A0AAW3B435_9TRYP